jgi:hypothetical protein
MPPPNQLRPGYVPQGPVNPNSGPMYGCPGAFFTAPWPAGLEDGWAPYFVSTDTNPLVLPPSTAAQLGPQTVTFQGDCQVLIVDWVCYATSDAGDLGFNVSIKWGARSWGIDNTQNGVPGVLVFGPNAQNPYRTDRPWLILPGTAPAIMSLTFTNTTTATNTIFPLLKGWRRDNAAPR